LTSPLRLRSDVELLKALAAASRGRVEFECLPTEARPELVSVF